jgi:superfamily II DNA/RNA helicase
MLALGFEEQLTVIASHIRPDRQTMLFTATFPGKLREVSAKWMRTSTSASGGGEGGSSGGSDDDTVIIRVNTLEFRSDDQQHIESAPAGISLSVGGVTDMDTADTKKGGQDSTTITKSSREPLGATAENASNASTVTTTAATSTDVVSGPGSTSLSLTLNPAIIQSVHVCASHKKPRLLINYVTKVREKEKTEKCRQGGPMIIFCTKIKTVSFVQNFLTKNGMLGVQQLHGQMPQVRREGVLADFKAVSCDLTV